VYLVVLQAERSVTTGIHNQWTEVREYYSGERRSLVAQLASAFHTTHPVRATRMRWLMRSRQDGFLAQFRWLWKRWRSSRSSACELHADQRSFLWFALVQLLARLEVSNPPLWDLVQLQEDLSDSLAILVEEMVQLPPSNHIENLGQTPWQDHLTLDELLPDWRDAAILAS
jgi:hypothetical protein